MGKYLVIRYKYDAQCKRILQLPGADLRSRPAGPNGDFLDKTIPANFLQEPN